MCGGSLEVVAAAWLCSASLHPAAALNEALSRPPGGPRVARGPLHPCQMAPQGLHALTSVPAPILFDREGSDCSVSQQCPAICPPGPPGPPGMPGFKVSSH